MPQVHILQARQNQRAQGGLPGRLENGAAGGAAGKTGFERGKTGRAEVFEETPGLTCRGCGYFCRDELGDFAHYIPFDAIEQAPFTLLFVKDQTAEHHPLLDPF
jgi:hypothetical protein